MQVFVTTYEVVGIGLPIIEQFNASVHEWKVRALAVSDQFGGVGVQPRHGEGIRAVLFAGDKPTGWRQIGKDPRTGNLQCVPNKGTKAGKAAVEALRSVGAMPKGEDAAALFGWNPRQLAMDTNRGVVYFPTVQTIELPSPRHFVRLPRFAEDGWAGHDGLREVAESEYMRAIEAHNAAVRDRKLAA